MPKNGHKLIHNFEKFTMDKCAAHLQYKWVAKDPTMPKNIVVRRAHCLEVMKQDSFVSPHNSDDEDGVQTSDQ